MNSLSIIHEETLIIEGDYYKVKSKIQEKLGEWSDLYVFDDNSHLIRYKTEGPLIPENNSKIPVLILLSNPHPHSVKQGMFLSPNRMGKGNPFWETLKNTGYFDYNGPICSSTMIKNMYESPFRFFMAVLLPFPSEDPEHLKTLLGSYEYEQMLGRAIANINNLIINHKINSVICFGKLQFNALSRRRSPDNYTSILQQGKIINESYAISKSFNLFLTYPTGWRFIADHRRYKADNLRNILNLILNNNEGK